MSMVGVFDSGVGGLSVLRSIQQRLPHEDLFYVADTAYVPYGEKLDTVILERSIKLSEYLLNQGAKALVVACNTATAVAITELRTRFSVPIVGIEPALKPALSLSKSRVIAVLATRSTLQSQKFQRLLEAHSAAHTVLSKACPQWVELVEQGDLSSPKALEAVALTLRPLLEQGTDTVVLGCTHFPFLEPLIRATAPQLQIIEPSLAVAARLESLLLEQNLLSSRDTLGQIRFTTTALPSAFSKHLRQLWQENPEPIGSIGL